MGEGPLGRWGQQGALVMGALLFLCSHWGQDQPQVQEPPVSSSLGAHWEETPV